MTYERASTFDAVAEGSDLAGTASQFLSPLIPPPSSGGYGGGGYGGGGLDSYLAHQPTAAMVGMTKLAQGLGAATGIVGMASGANDMADPENHWLGKRGLGLLNVISGTIGTTGSLAGLLGVESGFLGGMAGASAATGAAAGAGAAVSAGGSLLGAGLAGVGAGTYGDEAFRRFGLAHDGTTGEAQSITDASAEMSTRVADMFGGRDTSLGMLHGGLASMALAVPGAQLAAASTAVDVNLSLVRALAHLAD